MSDEALNEAFTKALETEKASERPDPLITIEMPLSIGVQTYAMLYVLYKHLQDDIYCNLRNKQVPSAYSRKTLEEMAIAINSFGKAFGKAE